MPKAPEELELDYGTLRSFGMAKVFKHHTSTVKSLDIDRTGHYLVTSGKDDAIHFYKVSVANPAKEQMLKKKVICKRFGASHVSFTHHPRTILAAGNDHNIRYHSLHDNAYLRVYKGHTGRIRGISMSPTNDVFMSWANDKTVRLWDLKSPGCTALVEVPGRPIANFDNEGLIFAISTASHEMKLYDARQYQNGPFDTFSFPKTSPGGWCGMEFSPDGKQILVSTTQNFMMTIDSFTGNVQQTFASHANDSGIELYGSFSSDGKYVGCGSSNGDIHYWDVNSGTEIAVWKGHPRPVQHIKWNPVFLSCVSASQATAIWHPRRAKSIFKRPTSMPVVSQQDLKQPDAKRIRLDTFQGATEEPKLGKR